MKSFGMFAYLRLFQMGMRMRGLIVVHCLWISCSIMLPLPFPVSAAPPAVAQPSGQVPEARLPLFRQIDAALVKTRLQKPEQLRLLVADDAPPFTYRNRNGALTGYAVAVAQAVCRRARTRCRFIVLPRAELGKALLDGRGDVVLSGLRPTAQAWRRFTFTRPYYKALGRFAVGADAKIAAASWEALAGRRVAVVKGSVHALWVIRHMGSVRLSLQPTFARASAELKAGRADALFADWLQLAFWVRGKQAAGCCRLLPQLIADRLFAYNHLSMALRAQDTPLRDFLDRYLDLLQEDGELRILARRFLPLATGTAKPAEAASGNSATPEKQARADVKP